METESLGDCYKIKFATTPTEIKSAAGHFNVFRIEDCLTARAPVKYSRRDFHKISMIRGNIRYHYANKSIEVSGTTLTFTNPNVPYAWEALSGEISGFFCIFTEAFFTEKIRGSLSDLPMFAIGRKPSYFLTKNE